MVIKMKRFLSILLVCTVLFSLNSEIVSAADSADFTQEIKAMFVKSDNSEAGEIDDFTMDVLQMIEEYPNENAYSQIVIDVNENTIKKDNEESEPLEQYDADYSAVESPEPVLPAVAVLENIGAQAEIDVQTGEVVADFDDETQRYAFAGESEEIEKKLDGEVISKKTENGVQEIITEKGKVTRNVGYMTEQQAQEGLNLETRYENGKIYITNPYQTKRLCVHMKKGKKLYDELTSVKSVNDKNGFYVLQFDSESDTKAAYEKLQKNSNVESVSCDSVVTAFASAIKERDGAKLIQSDRYKKYLKDNSKKSKIIVAVIDTGVDSTHPFLKSRMVKGKNFALEFGNKNNTGDVYGHGTHVAGIIADNTPSNVKIMPVKALGDDGSGSDLQIGAAIRYAADNGADVINMSLGGVCNGTCEMETAVNYAIKKGVTVCVAAGNETQDTKRVCPAKIKSCITVAASTNEGDRIASFSNYGSAVDITTPGVNILSCKTGGGYVSMSGTSMATPYAAAAAAMVLTNNPKLKPSEVEIKLKSSCADMLIKGNDKHSGAGLLNLGILLGDKKKAADLISVSNNELESDFVSSEIPFICDASVDAKVSCTDRSFTVSNSNSSVANYDGRFVIPKQSGKTEITIKLANGKTTKLKLNLKRTQTWIDYAAKSYAGGKGTKSSPYLISNAQELAKFAYDVRTNIKANAKCYKLTKDIDLKGRKWITAAYVNPDTLGMIVFRNQDSEFFNGVFDGNNHVIKNMDVLDTHFTNIFSTPETPDNIWIPLNNGFIDVIGAGTVKNLGIVDGFCYNSGSGLLCSSIFQKSRVYNCFTTGFSAGCGFAGSVTNYDVLVKNCFSSATVVRDGFVSTIYSSMEKGMVELYNCFFCGQILDNDCNSGGSGFAKNITSYKGYGHTKIYNCFSAANGVVEEGFTNNIEYSTSQGCYYADTCKKGVVCNTSSKIVSVKSKPVSFFKKKSSYTTASNWNKKSSWDFKNTWAIDPKVNNGFPYLKKMKFKQSSSGKSTSTWLDYASSSFGGGNGTKKSPYLVSNANQLARIAYLYRYGGGENVYFKLTRDIDLKGKNWYPIGGGGNINIYCNDEEMPDRKVFMGNIDGSGKAILNMTVKSKGDYVGFISMFGLGEIKNLNFKNADVSGRNKVGIICGNSRIKGKIVSCVPSGKVSGNDDVGSVSGINHSLAQIIGCKSSAAISAFARSEDYPPTLGGISGENEGYIEKCSFTGKLNKKDEVAYEGVIAGINRGVIQNCYGIGEAISVDECDRCYLINKTTKEVVVFDANENSKSYDLNSKLTEKNYKNFDFKNVWVMDESGYPKLRKVTKTAAEEALPSKYWTAEKSYAGGKGTKSNPYLIATAGQLLKINQCGDKYTYYRLIRNIDLGGKLWPTKEVGLYNIYGLHFDGNGKTIKNLTMKGGTGLFDMYIEKGYVKRLKLKNVKGSCTGAIAPGISDSQILDCTVTGTFDAPVCFIGGRGAQMNDEVAALAGEVHGSCTIKRCDVNVNIRGGSNVGSLFGYNGSDSLRIEDCAIRGSLFGRDCHFVGSGRDEEKCKNCYVSAKGMHNWSNQVSDSNIYFNKDLISKESDGKPLSTAQMKNKSSYKGFDFKNVWAISKDANGGYPYLRTAASKKITYILNGGKNVKYPETDYIPGNTVTLPMPKRSGYAFVGWYKSSKLSGAKVTQIASTDTKDMKLYAKWKKV